MHRDSLKIKGIVTTKRFDFSGKLLNQVTNRNLIVNTGLEFFIQRILNLTDKQLNIIGVGNGIQPSSLTQTGLTLGPSQIVHYTDYEPIRFKKVETNNLVVESLFKNNRYSNKEVAEIGLFTDEVFQGTTTPTTMIARTVIEPQFRFTKAQTDFLSVSWTIVFGD